MKSFLAALILFFSALCGPARADAPEMAFPLVCTPGLTCFITGYADVDAAPGAAKDYLCGPSSADGDPFLHIAIPDVGSIPQGFPVLSAADGRVADVMDGVADRVAAAKTQIKKGTAVCGNGVIIDHGDAIRTGYCHLRRGSITVHPGEHVVKGQVIGFVGQSGVALWPQLGFSVQDGGMTLDPMTGRTPLEGCGFRPRPMIALPEMFKTYQPAAIVSIGFATAPQTENKAALGRAQRLARMNPAEPSITLWGIVLGVRKGDRLAVKLRTPEGRVFDHQAVDINADQPRYMFNISRARGYSYWREGVYTAEVSLTRDVQLKAYSLSRQVSLLVQKP